MSLLDALMSFFLIAPTVLASVIVWRLIVLGRSVRGLSQQPPYNFPLGASFVKPKGAKPPKVSINDDLKAIQIDEDKTKYKPRRPGIESSSS